MGALSAVNKYFWKYKFRFLIGIGLVVFSNYVAVLVPELTGYVIDKLQANLPGGHPISNKKNHDAAVVWMIHLIDGLPYRSLIITSCLILIGMAFLRGLLMFFMRQTLIVMSRHIEYDQKNEVYNQYQQLDATFYKLHSTGDLMNRMAEDVGRVRAYTGPAIMYFANMITLIIFCVVNMLRKDVHLTVMALAPLPILGLTIYWVNRMIMRKSQRVQELLSDLTTNVQESFSGIRVIKSYVQEKAMFLFFEKNSEDYRKNNVALAKTEAIYFPTMMFIIGLSTIVTVLVGAKMAIMDTSKVSIVVEFVIYVNMLTFPVGAIGWIASMTQRAATSQKRLNEFLELRPIIRNADNALHIDINGNIDFDNVSYIYQNTGIKALDHFNLHIRRGQKILVLGKTGSGKTTMAQMLLRFFDPVEGAVKIDGHNIQTLDLQHMRSQMSYVPQDVFLFSDTVSGNISFGMEGVAKIEDVVHAASLAAIDKEVAAMPDGYATMVGERGVTLSGGQKQRISIARALLQNPDILILDDCLSAVDNKTEHLILNNLAKYMGDKTALVITHRIFTAITFDQIIVMDHGKIIEQGTHAELMSQRGYYADLYSLQLEDRK